MTDSMRREPPDIDAVRRTWCAVLGLPEVDVDVNFFDAGGHSLLVMVLQEQLERLAGRQVPIEALFAHVTVRSQTAYLSGDRITDPGAARVRTRADRRNLLGRARPPREDQRPTEPT